MADVLNIDDYRVDIDGEQFSLIETPRSGTRMVTAQKAQVLKTLRLDDLVSKLQRTGDFINLAYNSTPAKYGEIRAPIGRIHDRFGVLCGKCMQEMGAIESATQELLPTFNRVFKFLVNGQDSLALVFLARASSVAQKLGASMDVLAREFESLANDSSDVLQTTEKARGTELKNAEELRVRAQDLEARIAEAEELSRRLEQSRKELEKLYEEAKRKTEKAEDRSFALSMVGAVLAPIAQAAGAFAGAFAGSKTPANPQIPPDAPRKTAGADAGAKQDDDALKQEKEKAAKAADAARLKKSDAEAALAAAQKKQTQASAALLQAQAAVDEAKDAEKKKAAEKDLSSAKLKDTEATQAATRAKDAMTQADKSLSDAEARLATASKALSDYLQNVANGLKTEGDGYAAVAEGYRQEKLKYLDLLMQKKDKEIEVSANLQKYAVEMKNAHAQEMTAELTAKALFNVIAALRQVVGVLRDMTFFWSGMSAHCGRLADPGFAAQVKAMQSESVELKRELYADPDFKKDVVRYVAGWVALGDIANEYMRATSGIRDQVKKDYENYLDDDGARRVASSLGARLLGDIQADMDAANDDKQALAAEKTATQKALETNKKAA